MEMCRVCLNTEKETLPLNETFVVNYNLLTNLNITLLDGMPQYSCQTCLDTVKYFIEFREKCITSETTLREVIYSDVKVEPKTHKIEIKNKIANSKNADLITIKSEIKEEQEDICDDFDITHIGLEEYSEDIKNFIDDKDDEEEKPKKIKRKKKRNRTSHLVENLAIDFEKRWFCGICPETFDNNGDLNNHVVVHQNQRQCELCKEQLNSFSQLLAHRMLHVPKRQHCCHICTKRFRSCLYLEHHYRSIHIAGEDSKLSCKYCQSKYDTPKKLSSHTLQVHSSIKYICDLCTRGFKSKTNLKSHIKFHSENKAYVCDLCGFSCKHSGGLKDHKIRRHTAMKVICKNCKRPFTCQEEHDKHTCRHKFIVCPVCGRQMNGNSRLSRHMMIHSGIKKYECKRCPAKYRSKGALVAHINRHDGNRTKQCEYCPAKFYTDTVLIKHRRIHTGEKPYVCKVCNKGFTGNHNLKVHMKVHGEYLIVKKQEDLSNVTN